MTHTVGETIDLGADGLAAYDMTLTAVTVLDMAGNRLTEGSDASILSTTDTGSYCVVLSVTKQGEYVEAGNDSVKTGYECAFVLKRTE